MPGKHCCYGTCKSDSRYPERFPNVEFFAFPKPKTRLSECEEWIQACGRPHEQLNVQVIGKHHYVCSEHFVEGKPTSEWPYPMPSDGSPVVRGRCRNKWQQRKCYAHDAFSESSMHNKVREAADHTLLLRSLKQPCNTVVSGLELLASSAVERKIDELERANIALHRENIQLKAQVQHLQDVRSKPKHSVCTQTGTLFEYVEASQSKVLLSNDKHQLTVDIACPTLVRMHEQDTMTIHGCCRKEMPNSTYWLPWDENSQTYQKPKTEHEETTS